MPYIYKISNDINDKLYIGKTLYTIERRWSQHKNNAKNRQDLKHLPYDSVREASLAIQCDNSYLSKICKNNKIAFGYKWEYQNNDYIKKDFTAKPVCKLDLKTGKVLEVYPSGAAAARAVNGDSSYISKVCRGIQKSSKGFGWCYLNPCN